MTSTAILFMVTEIIGGLAFFLFGMNTMSNGLAQLAGGSLEKTVKKMTANDFVGFLLGAGITVAIQSSSAVTVMIVGLVNSGVMPFADTFGMILGSNVGTTLTAWITTLSGIQSGGNFFLALLEPATFAPVLAFIGIAMRMLSKSEKKANTGLIFLGFAILMSGMSMMSGAVASVKDSPFFINMLTAFESPLIALLVSIVFTGIIQSSAATVVIVQSLALAGAMSYRVAIPLIIGANIGTCITALISAIGTNKEARKVVLLHIYINTLGGILCIALLYLGIMFNPAFLTGKVGVVGVAVVHSLFNILNALLFLPLKKPLVKVCEKTVLGKKDETAIAFLDERVLNNIPIAIAECTRLKNEMSKLTADAVKKSLDMIFDFSADKFDEIIKTEAVIDEYEQALNKYLVFIGSKNITRAESYAVARMLHSIGDIERVSDYAVNLGYNSKKFYEKKISVHDTAANDMNKLNAMLKNMIDMSFSCICDDNTDIHSAVLAISKLLFNRKEFLKGEYATRYEDNNPASEAIYAFFDVLANLERISDRLSRLVSYNVHIINEAKGKKDVKAPDITEAYNKYDQMYSL